MFNYFKFKKSQREEALQPKDSITWIKHITSEIIGTIWISLALAGLSILINGKALETYFLLHNVIVGFFAGFIVVGSCLFIFGRWSVDLNPSVTIYRMINGKNTVLYGFIKLLCQLIGAIIAGLIIYVIGESTNHGNAANISISTIVAAEKDFLGYNNSGNRALIDGSLWIFFGEMIMTSVLLFSIFSPRIDAKYRDLLILFIISLSVWMGILQGSAAINPARGLAQQIPDLFFGIRVKSIANIKIPEKALLDLVLATVMMILGGLFAPFFYALIQGFTEKYFNNWINGIIQFKNHQKDNLISNSQRQNK